MKEDYWGLYWYLVVKKLFKQLEEYNGWEFIEEEDVRIRSDQSACEKIEAFIQAKEEEPYVVSTPRIEIQSTTEQRSVLVYNVESNQYYWDGPRR